MDKLIVSKGVSSDANLILNLTTHKRGARRILVGSKALIRYLYAPKFQELQNLHNTLDPIRPEPVYTRDTILYPRNYEAEIYALMDMEAVFVRRLMLRAAKFGRHITRDITLPAKDKFYALQKQHADEHNACNRDENCHEAAMRKFCCAKVSMLLTYNPSFQGSWKKIVLIG